MSYRIENNASDPVKPAKSLTPEQIKFYKGEGYLILPGLISAEDAAALHDEVMHIMDIIGLGTTKLKQTREYLPGTRLDTFVNSPNLKDCAGALMEGESSLYLPFTAVKSGTRPGASGGGEFHYHQDNQYTRFDGPGINLWFGLVPMTAENGCLKIVPRSHLQGTLPSYSPDGDGHKSVTYEPDDFVSILMQPGDCVAFSRLTIHGSGPNQTPEHRVGYAVQFYRDDVSYSLDGGETYQPLKGANRWSVSPVEKISIPEGKTDGH